MLRKMTVHCVSVQPLPIVLTHVCLRSGPRADFTGRAARFHDSRGPNRKHTRREGKRAVLHTTVQVVPGAAAAGHCGLCCFGCATFCKANSLKVEGQQRLHVDTLKTTHFPYEGFVLTQTTLFISGLVHMAIGPCQIYVACPCSSTVG